ncbi:stage II sporulation protein P [Sporomusa acidovorans]|uniref:Stage II sporulation protein P n=1 Tax=Sporomusa acidovorans (strain ATCC 49682 / DSM 3132 / Mol) TaxID=1123286 RepID=A0ABZ3J414_SPOA4|nr:stage II sporulation protein P [Sporomusa acidovorans]OZC20303.1 stage II sporulation protein SpoIIP [Sporomusa acidovorans DSM 3132]SDD38649.1 stage II sporulation protein P [Sporomusa acidovorans]
MINKVFATFLTLLLIASNAICYANDGVSGNYSTVIDEAGNSVYTTGWTMRPGDQILTGNNRRYEVFRIEGNNVYAKFVGEVDLSAYYHEDINILNRLRAYLKLGIAEAEGNGKVAIYHTHSDESYVPTDGQESILGAGGIYKVGDAFTSSLEKHGITVIHSQAKHDPHDDMAYERSRRTAMDLIKKEQPDAIFDIHRDAVPPEVYKTNIDGQDVSKVQLVVGKYGATGKQIEDYALQIKAAADKQHPGLIKGIFFAKGGDYNQDLHPRSILLEVGAHTNDRESAERGIALFSDVVPTILGKSSTPTGPNAAGETGAAGNAGLGSAAGGASGATKSIGWILGILLVGSAAFLLLSTGSVKEAGAKLKNFASTEFTNFIGAKKKKKSNSHTKSENPKQPNDNE